MNAKTNTAKQEDIEPQAQPEKEKICFVIMPIADIPGYDSGHFTRVYNHLIKPACKAAGFKAIRADDVSSSRMIVVDILQKIVESDIAICDLSGRNPNVLYELGLRQAFNKKTVLIKDNKTENIFDVQGFRHALYDNALRIDNVKNEILKISNALTETFEAKNDINSIVQLLKIEPANIENKTQLTEGDTYLLNAINEIKTIIERNGSEYKSVNIKKKYKKSNFFIFDNEFKVGKKYYIDGDFYGVYLGISTEDGEIYFEDRDGSTFNISLKDNILRKIDNIPF